ncbi:AbrB/MazE/SpoVT family DNA-binding domain-containing protein [Ferrovibrio xuzhouensis]|uniref:AbrB/MazE/SpoVT family DNA-binding domain-containing protein n=1 Tax=Ferrovibrio xuzhouensis TaxID=1576914 RepID=A0ABV7VK61_9PROT
MRITLKKWGNNAAVRLPAAIMQAAGLKLDEQLEVRTEGGRIIIEKVNPYDAEPPAFDLETLMDGVHAGDAPELVSFGGPVGDEAW